MEHMIFLVKMEGHPKVMLVIANASVKMDIMVTTVKIHLHVLQVQMELHALMEVHLLDLYQQAFVSVNV
jgi:hypothetical protein